MKNKKDKLNSSIINERHIVSKKRDNGLLKLYIHRDENGNILEYSLAYINLQICSKDNGRVLGYDNAHGYHHRHYKGKIESVKYESYEKILDVFENEWRKIHEKIK